jgi:hypothetical protein
MSDKICKFVSRPTCLQCIQIANSIPEKKKPAYYKQYEGLRTCYGCVYLQNYVIKKDKD